MGTQTLGLADCPACGRTYRYKPKLAGKKVVCVCRSVFRFPKELGGKTELLHRAPEASHHASPSIPTAPHHPPQTPSGWDLTGLDLDEFQSDDQAKRPTLIEIKVAPDVKDRTIPVDPENSESKVGSLSAAIAATREAVKPAHRESSLANDQGSFILQVVAPGVLGLAGVALLFAGRAMAVNPETGTTLRHATVATVTQLVFQPPFVIIGVFLSVRFLRTELGSFANTLVKLAALALFAAGLAVATRALLGTAPSFMNMAVDRTLELAAFWGCCAGLLKLDFSATALVWALGLLVPGFLVPNMIEGVLSVLR